MSRLTAYNNGRPVVTSTARIYLGYITYAWKNKTDSSRNLAKNLKLTVIEGETIQKNRLTESVAGWR
ncbi:hypothetical protein BgiMline_014178, partial [Biomphalaria glabrata]